MSLYLLHDFLGMFFMAAINRNLVRPSDEDCKEKDEAWEIWFGENAEFGKGNLTGERWGEYVKEFPCEEYELKG